MDQKGYTLIELILYVVVVAILLSAVTSFFGLTVEARVKNQSISEVNQQGLAAMEQMAQTARNATAITSPASGTTAAALTVVVPTASNSPTIYDVSSSTLRIKEGAATAIPLTNNKVQVTALSIKNLTRTGTDGALQINLTLSRANSSGLNMYDYQKTFTTTVTIR